LQGIEFKLEQSLVVILLTIKQLNLNGRQVTKTLMFTFLFFDNILIVDNSENNTVYTNLLQIENREVVVMTVELPTYIAKRLPAIFKLLNHQ
jgi:hypothetical protein